MQGSPWCNCGTYFSPRRAPPHSSSFPPHRPHPEPGGCFLFLWLCCWGPSTYMELVCDWASRFQSSSSVTAVSALHFFKKKLQYNSHTKKLTLLCVQFSVFLIYLQNCATITTYVIPEGSHSPKRNVILSGSHSPPPPPALATMNLLSVSTDLSVLHVSCKLIHIWSFVSDFFYLPKFFRVHPGCSMNQHFLTFYD